ncbi:PHP domain-containing protein [Candidatus Bathyarchaeota archaeon]|nr:PHP domain-containing protein [Candidatus Bathyarchaeota archaeon]
MYILRLKLDLHIHSIYSKDSSNTIEVIFDRIRKLGLDGFALADHDTIEGIPRALSKKDDIIFIPALEISAKGAHILALDPVEIIPAGLGIVETVELIQEQGSVALLAHPYGFPRSWVKPETVENAGFDAIEVANSAQFPYKLILEKNLKLAEKLGLPQTGGSDSHIPSTIGNAYTIIESSSREINDILDAIIEGKTTWYGTSISIIQRIKKYLPKR